MMGDPICGRHFKMWITIGVMIVSVTAAFIRTESIAASNKEKIKTMQEKVERKLEHMQDKVNENSRDIAVIKEKATKTERDVGKILDILQNNNGNGNVRNRN